MTQVCGSCSLACGGAWEVSAVITDVVTSLLVAKWKGGRRRESEPTAPGFES